MNKIIINTIFILVLLMFFNLVNPAKSEADWWTRPEERPTQPSTPRDVVLLPTQPQSTSVPPTVAPTTGPTSAPTIQPTTTAIQPTATPRIGGGPTVVPTQPPSSGDSGSSSGSNGNACDPGKPYSGPYCGWSPSTSGGSAPNQPRIGGGPQVLGLSYTSGSEVAWSDIIMFAGVLCLALYARSKFIIDNKLH